MKIVHCCFGNEHYIDTWGYQQNLLPLYHAKLGHETVVLASNDIFPSFVSNSTIEDIKKKGDSYYNGLVRIERCPSFFHSSIHFQKAKGLFQKLEQESPEIIFFHGCLNLSLFSCVKYKQHHPDISLFVDNHGDTMNVNPSKLYRFLFFKVFWSSLHTYFQKYVDMYFGVTQGRCDFLRRFFHIKSSHIRLLPIGADVDAAADIKESMIELRLKHGFSGKEILLVHGGKLDYRKGTSSLISVYRQLKQDTGCNIRLILFGNFQDERISNLVDSDIIVYGWLSRKETFELFKMANLAVWPIHHTTLIEDCVAAGLPYLIRKTETTQHLINSDFFLTTDSESELYEKIISFIETISSGKYTENVIAMRKAINYYTKADMVVKIHYNIHE